MSFDAASLSRGMFRFGFLSLYFVLVLSQSAHGQGIPPSGNTCNGTYTGTFNGNVTLSAGQTCFFTGGGITGNVTLNGGGTLNLNGAAVQGNVETQGGGNVVLVGATVGGNVQFNNGGTFSIGPSTTIGGNLQINSLPAAPAQNQICGTTVTSDLQFQNNRTAVLIGAASNCAGNSIGGNLTVQNNAAATTLAGNTVNGDLQNQGNTAQTQVIGNSVAGNLTVQNNTAPVTVAGNNVQKNMLCQNNSTISAGFNNAGQNQGCPTTPQPSGSSSSGAPEPLTALVNAPTSVIGYAAVILDGSSSASTATITSYAWQQTAGPAVILLGSNTAQASFTAPQVANQTQLSFTLTVQDTTGATSQASATVQVLPATPAQLTPTFVDLSLFQPFAGNAHNNLQPFDGPPLSGSTLIVQATLSGAITSPAFAVVDANGKTLSALTLSLAGSASLQPLDFVGTMAIPSVPFRVVASGTTTNGQSYSLPSPALITPMYMTIAFIPPTVLLPPGASTTAAVQILNAGPDATFTVLFSDPSHLLSQSQSISVQITAGQAGTVPVTITFPATPNGLIHGNVTATASVNGNPTRVGSATLNVWLDGAP